MSLKETKEGNFKNENEPKLVLGKLNIQCNHCNHCPCCGNCSNTNTDKCNFQGCIELLSKNKKD